MAKAPTSPNAPISSTGNPATSSSREARRCIHGTSAATRTATLLSSGVSLRRRPFVTIVSFTRVINVREPHRCFDRRAALASQRTWHVVRAICAHERFAAATRRIAHAGGSGMECWLPPVPRWRRSSECSTCVDTAGPVCPGELSILDTASARPAVRPSRHGPCGERLLADMHPSAGSRRSSVNSSCRQIRRRIVSAIPPGARPSMRPETVTLTVGS